MIEKINILVTKAKEAAETILDFHGDIRLITHYDADGITSSAIMLRALLREGKDVHLTFVKQLKEKIAKELAEDIEKKIQKNKISCLVIFTDLGSGQLENIQKYLTGEDKKIIIIDHHQPQGTVYAKNLMHINPVNFGINENISGAGVAYIVARAMNPENMDLSELAIVGAIADSQIGNVGPDWRLLGLNNEILKDAEKTKKIRVKKGLRLWGRSTRPIHKALEYSYDPYIPGVSGSESGSVQLLKEIGIEIKEKGNWRTLADLSLEEQKKLASAIIKERLINNQENPHWVFGDVYDLTDKKEIKDANEFATFINATGKLQLGYLGISMCLNDFEVFDKVKKALAVYRRGIGKALDWLNKNKDVIRETENASYILAGKNISEHIISNVTSIVKTSGMLPNKPIFSFADTEEGDVKISARSESPDINLKDIVASAAKEVGGEGGGHIRASGASIPEGTEEIFINCVEKILEKDKNKEEYDRRGEGKTGERTEGREDSKEMEGKGLVQYFGS